MRHPKATPTMTLLILPKKARFGPAPLTGGPAAKKYIPVHWFQRCGATFLALQTNIAEDVSNSLSATDNAVRERNFVGYSSSAVARIHHDSQRHKDTGH
jgi:hypothetical protein